MRLAYLKIENYKALNFEHSFDSTGRVVITGINGSGKSTLIEAIELLLSNQQPNANTAQKITGDKATLHIKIMSSEQEVDELTSVIARSAGNFSREQIAKQLNSIFGTEHALERRIEINREVLTRSWDVKEDVLGVIDPFSEQTLNPNITSTLRNYLVKRVAGLRNLNPPFVNNSANALDLSGVLVDSDRDDNQGRFGVDLNLSGYINYLLDYKPAEGGELAVQELLDSYSDLLSPLQVVRETRSGQETIVAQKGAKRFLLSHLSSGQKQALSLLTLFEVWEKSPLRPILLLDEPESGLHPGLVEKLFGLINEKLNSTRTDNSIIVATHSSEVVAMNPDNIYRIVTNDGSRSELVKVSSLEQRASLLNELGVRFHMDFVAQRIVFVESNAKKRNGISDDRIYQELIDPSKESVYFTLVPKGGSRSQVEQFVAEFKERLIQNLGGDSEFICQLVDRDDDTYQPGKNTPFRHIEYLFLCDLEITLRVLNEVMDVQLGIDTIHESMKLKDVSFVDDPLNAQAKDIWKEVLNRWGAGAASGRNHRELIEKKIIMELRTSPHLPPEIVDFMRLYKNGEIA